MQKYSIVSVQIAAETSVGIGPFSDPVSALTDQDSETHVIATWLANACYILLIQWSMSIHSCGDIFYS